MSTWKMVRGTASCWVAAMLQEFYQRLLPWAGQLSGTRKLGAAVRIRLMAGRAIRTTSRITFLLCGLVSLLTCVPYVMLRGAELPVQNEWVIFAVALALVGVFSVTLAVLPRSWIAKACKKDRDDEQLFSAPLKPLGGFAAISYLVALVAYFAPHRRYRDPHLTF